MPIQAYIVKAETNADVGRAIADCLAAAVKIGFPVRIRPAFALGVCSVIAEDADEFSQLASAAIMTSPILELLVEPVGGTGQSQVRPTQYVQSIPIAWIDRYLAERQYGQSSTIVAILELVSAWRHEQARRRKE